MKKITMRWRQGDVELSAAAQPTMPLQPAAKDPVRGVVLAYGELTGHAHRLPSTAELFEALEEDGPRLLHVTEPCDLEHEEHPPIRLQPGWYYVGVKRQYEPEGGWSAVQD